MDLLVASRFEPVMASLQRELPQAILIHGQSGVGLTTIAKHIAGTDHELIEPVAAKPKASPAISIDVIRELYVQTRAKHDRQVFVIDGADTMSAPAQHAFLKLLEEPNPNTHFILVTHQPDALLETVRSRLQTFHAPRVPSRDFQSFVASIASDTVKRQQINFVADGRPALARKLVGDDARLDSLATVMRDAKVFVGADRYEACRVALRYSGSKDNALELVDASIQVLRHTVTETASAPTITGLSSLVDAYEQLRANAQPRLQLLSYVVQ